MTIVHFPTRQRGMSIAELMVSVTIGLLITLAISTLFLNTNRSNKENSATNAMQENARFAMESIAEDLRHVGFFGNVQNPADIERAGVTMPSGTDCGETATASYMLDFSSARQLIGYGIGMTNTQIATLVSPCTLAGTLPAATNSLLAIKRTSTTRMSTTSTLQAGHIYVHSNGSSASLGVGTALPLPSSSTQVWEYSPRIYYITSDRVLYRGTFGADWINEPLAEGIEQFRVEFGVDTDNNGAPNYFSDISSDSTFDKVVAARLYILARTPTPDLNYTDDNTYNLGSLTWTPSTDVSNTDPNKTRYHRQVYSTTVNIPNLRIRNVAN
jgi:type IV pilus assembly protein PilW